MIRFRVGLRTGVLLVVGVVGIAWALFLMTGSLAKADSLSSVISGFTALLFGIPAMVSWYRDAKTAPDAAAGKETTPTGRLPWASPEPPGRLHITLRRPASRLGQRS
jgi:hypothetical protein